MSSIIKQLLLQFILILLNAFFAATEIALISINEKKVRALAEDGDKKAKKMLKIIEEPTKFLSTIQIGITLAGFLGSAFAANNFAERLCAFAIKAFDISPAYHGVINTVSVIIITLILSYFTLVLGELVPKRIAMKHKEKLANYVCGIISALATVLKPIIWFLTASTNLMLRLFGIDPHGADEAVSEEDIVIMLDAGADEGTLNQGDIEYIKNVFKLDKLCAADIMTPRSAVVAVSEDISRDALLALIEREGYSRIPVFDGSFDKVIGILHTRQYLLKYTNKDFSLSDALLPPEFVPETIRLDVLLKSMQSKHAQMVIVVNEYGFTSGIVTIEDVLEEIVGEIWDEQDEATTPIINTGEGTYRVLTSISIDEFFEFFHLQQNDEIESTTLNGWLTENCGNIPEKGYAFHYQNLIITVIKADDLMTHEVNVTVTLEEAEQDESTAKEQ